MDEQTDCRQLKQQLSDFLDGELPPRQAAELQRHLNDCQNCHTLADTLSKTIQLYHRLPQPELPPDAAERLRKSLKANGCLNDD